jgi:hypothetical protein
MSRKEIQSLLARDLALTGSSSDESLQDEPNFNNNGKCPLATISEETVNYGTQDISLSASSSSTSFESVPEPARLKPHTKNLYTRCKK